MPLTGKTYDIVPAIAARAHVTQSTYQTLYERSIDEPDAFWAEQARRFVTWFTPWQPPLQSRQHPPDRHRSGQGRPPGGSR